VPELELLPAAAADDAALVATVTDLVNRAYAVAERGLWRDGLARTTLPEIAAAVRDGELAVAREEGRGIGGALVDFAVPHGAGRGRRHAADVRLTATTTSQP
jgi:hypothetical protein